MKEMKLSPDDPKLTAYALGELAGDDRAAVEAALRKNPALRAAVEEIRATAAQLEAAFAEESAAAPTPPPFEQPRPADVIPFAPLSAPSAMPPPTKRRRVVVEPVEEAEKPKAEPYPVPQVQRSPWRIPQVYYLIGGAAAACFAVIVALRKPPVVTVVVQAPLEAKVYREIPLAPPVEKPEGSLAEGPANASSPDALATVPVPAMAVAGGEKAVTGASSTEAGPVAPAFIDKDFSLLSQVKQEQGRAMGDPAFPASLAPAPLPAVAGAAVSGAVAPASSMPAAPDAGLQESDTTLVRPANVVSTPVAAHETAPVPVKPTLQLSFTAVPPTVAESMEQGGVLAAALKGSSMFALNSSITATPGTGETVVLSAMRVSANRAVGFATEGNGRNEYNRNGVFDRAYLPSPPLGARFARGGENYAYARDNEFLRAARDPLSTFAVDVDTASYANVRRIIEHGTPPPRDAVRIEELLNYFPYSYPAPKGTDPIAATLEVAEAPWAPTHRLVRIGLKARDVPNERRAPVSLVFLIDTSSSMNEPNKLPLVKHSLRRLLGRLRTDDRVAIVSYAGNAGLVLPSTPVAHAREIMHALDALTPGMGSNGSAGIQLAYDLAQANFQKDGSNRIVLCTDGDFDLGLTSEGELVRFIEQKTPTGVSLTVLGFGMGNYKDATLEKLASVGRGTYGYIDTPREAEKLLVEQVSSTLITVARDVKLQVEFNSAKVSSYRLIGYENRLLRKEDFNHDKNDGGEIGAGHTLTALYEVVPVGAEDGRTADEPPLEELRYAANSAFNSRMSTSNGARDPFSNELLIVRVRYKKPGSFLGLSRSVELPLVDAKVPFERASADFRFAAAVAQFGMILRGSAHRGEATMTDVASWAEHAITPENDSAGYRNEFVELVRKTQAMLE